MLSQTTLAALKSRLTRDGPVALRDMDALCIKGWSKTWPCHEPAPEVAQRQPKTQDQRRSLGHQGSLARCTERRQIVADFYIALANTIVLVRRLLRRAWTLYRWDTRPRRRP